jgi:hypothetical protein
MLKPILPIIVLLSLFCDNVNSQTNFHPSDSVGLRRNSLIKATSFTAIYYSTSILVLSNTWYKDKEVVSFHFYNDNKGFMQVDKFGHMFGSYAYSYMGYYGLLKMGATRREALLYGSTLGFVLQLPIEIMDGIHEGYGFSWGDFAANAMGSALVLGQELLFNDQVVKNKFSYWESEYTNNSNGYFGKTALDKFFNDYNGHTYWFSMPINRIALNKYLPGWICISAGYSANGMYGEFSNITNYNGFEIPSTQRYRQYLLSLDIDWTRVKTDSKVLQVLLKGLTFVKLPFPALEYNSKGQFKGHWIYF